MSNRKGAITGGILVSDIERKRDLENRDSETDGYTL